MKLLFFPIVVAVVGVGCGGKAVVDNEPSGQGGQGASGQGGAGAIGPSGSTGATGASTANSVSSSGTGGGPCDDHNDCSVGEVCIFVTGTCAPACDGGFCATCTPGSICDSCATSSCPACADCRGACVPTPPGRCDEQNPCPPETPVCIFSIQQCAPACIATGTGCREPGMICADCVTGSCCGCDDCVSACLFPEG